MKVLSVKVIKNLVIEILGWLLVVVGLAALVLPGPGLLALFAGLALLANRYEWASRRLEPVKKAAIKAAKDGVSSKLNITASVIGALALMGMGVLWIIGPVVPSWWPVSDKLWLIGGSGTGGTLIGSGVIALAMIVYSYIQWHPKKKSK